VKKTISLEIEGMYCSNCEEKIEKKLLGLKGIEKAEVNLKDETAEISFDADKTSLDQIKGSIVEVGYGIKGDPDYQKEKMSIKEGLVYGLVPHIGCIGFIVASILGVTIAIEFFKPLLMNPWFFHILVIIAIGFATISSALYLRKNGLLSWVGVKRKKKYLSTMYGSTVGINLVLFLAVFPMLSNLDTGSFADTPTGAVTLAGAQVENVSNSLVKLQVDIPCPGHAPLISGELKTISGVTGVLFSFPNYFDVAYNSERTSIDEILSLEVFGTYKAGVMELKEGNLANDSIEFEELKEVEGNSYDESTAGGSCGSEGCSAGNFGNVSRGANTCGSTSCGCGG